MERGRIDRLYAMAEQDVSPNERDIARGMLKSHGLWPRPVGEIAWSPHAEASFVNIYAHMARSFGMAHGWWQSEDEYDAKAASVTVTTSMTADGYTKMRTVIDLGMI